VNLGQRVSARLNFLDRNWSQHKQANEDKNQASLPLLWPSAPQIDAYCADRSAQEAHD
jgi:hypothetical protein